MGNFLWVKQSLENEIRCLLIVSISLNITKIGLIKTMAAVFDQSLEIYFYILGNETNFLAVRERFK